MAAEQQSKQGRAPQKKRGAAPIHRLPGRERAPGGGGTPNRTRGARTCQGLRHSANRSVNSFPTPMVDPMGDFFGGVT